jgi:hypothetical protein
MFLGSKVRRVRGADILTAISEPIVGFLTSHNPIGLHGLLRGWFYFFFFTLYSQVSRTKWNENRTNLTHA